MLDLIRMQCTKCIWKSIDETVDAWSSGEFIKVYDYKEINQFEFDTIIQLNKIIKQTQCNKLLVNIGLFNNLSQNKVWNFIERETDLVAFYGINYIQLLEYRKLIKAHRVVTSVKFFNSRDYAISWLLKPENKHLD